MTADVIETEFGAVSLERVGAGPDLIMLHSLLSDRHVFDPVVGRLAERWTVNLVDLPGFGSTVMVPPDIDAYADLVGAMLAGYDPATTSLLGNGLGAFVALGTAIRHGSRFDRLVLVGCGAGFPDEAKGAFRTMVARVREDGMEAVLDIAVRRIFTAEFLPQHPEMAEQRRTVLRRTNPAAFENACQALERLDYRDQAKTVTNPTLVVVGSDDEATPSSLGEDLAKRIPGAAYLELPNVAHAPQLQDPAAFLAAVVPFLNSDGVRSA